MTRDQKVVAIGAVSGIVVMLLAMWLLYRVLPAPQHAGNLTERIGYALRWQAFAALPLFLMLAAVGNARFLSEAIDPTLGAEDSKTIINGRAADNSLQQFVLFAAGSLALAASLDSTDVRAVGAAAIVFVAMRIAFWVGYRIHPLYRAFGFAGTAYLNLGLLLAVLWFAVR